MRLLTPNKEIGNFLKSVPLFGGLEGHWLTSVMSVLKVNTFASGTAIFREGEIGRSMHLVRTGEVEVFQKGSAGRQISVVRLGPGECFGEMALVELQPRSATVVARKKTVTYSLTNVDLYKLFQEDHYAYVIVLQNICRLLSRRLRKADSRICGFLEQPEKARGPRLRASGARA